MRPVTIFLLATFAMTAPAIPAFAQTPSPPAPSEATQPESDTPQAGAPAERQDDSPEASPAGGDRIGVPAKVWAVRIAGGWEADGQRGFSRVIGTFEGDRQKLTVQWLAAPDGRVINAVELDDEEAAKLTFGDMRAEPEDRGGVTVFLDTLPDRDGLRDTWVLIIGAPGEARFGPATN
ncbi:MAG: hypothetical protein DI565_10610 [Ancylobacter novellus]|uniref:Uncharacterized protein n=1 Tax=Ancylobacter novellus TaxID=921 RepID=A0A2W5KJ30_ANCNO|nr:MAG: hypothetical protein DI565_10610 [Ancylobacter novellus]